MNNTSSLLQPLLGAHGAWFFRDSLYWTIFGLFGNALFSSRFVIQWLYSERHKQVVVPPIFWHLSFWGSVVSLAYACHVDRLPIILGYAFLPFLYARNLHLLKKGGSGQVQVRQEAKAIEAKSERV